MADRLVTIATFDQVAQAYIAKNALEAAGIQASITDEETVGMLWTISTAVGGVKVIVREEDAERAVAVLENELGPDEGGEIDQKQLAVEAEAAMPEEEETPVSAPDSPAREGISSTLPVTDDYPPLSERDEYARRLFFTAWLGIGCFPLAFVALYFFLNAAFGSSPLSARGRYNLIVGGSVTVGALCLSLLICAGLGGAFR